MVKCENSRKSAHPPLWQTCNVQTCNVGWAKERKLVLSSDMRVDEMGVVEMWVGKMRVCEMRVGEMRVGEMSPNHEQELSNCLSKMEFSPVYRFSVSYITLRPLWILTNLCLVLHFPVRGYYFNYYGFSKPACCDKNYHMTDTRNTQAHVATSYKNTL